MAHRGINYIPEIDGLRAIAVLSVMLYHANPAWLPGGFAGVDVFFVISGYLITKVIASDISDGSFTLWRFWDRRVRRIVPPLLVVLGATLAAGYALLSPSELAGLGGSAFASLISAGNVYFWISAGSYFGLAAPLLPLLHLWSLGVEEQFYVIYPILFLLLAKYWRQALQPMLWLGVILSLALATYTAASHPAASFYLPMSRAWELGTGCAVALWRPHWIPPRALVAEVATSAALLALIACFLAYDDLTPWPGPWTTVIVAASAILIRSAPVAPVAGRVLALRPMVAIGLVSYATYLWHHPLLSLVRVADPNNLTPGKALLLLAASLGLGAMSYRYIERPVRDRTRMPARLFWPLVIAAGAVVAAASLYAWRSKGMPERLPPHLNEVAAMTEAYPREINPCFFPADQNRKIEESCMRGAAGPIRMAMIGDSHAMALAPGFDPLLADTGTRARLLIAAGCPPVTDERVMNVFQPHCPAFERSVLDWLEAHPEVRVVAVAARWPYSFHHSFYDNGEGGVELGPDDGLGPDAARDRLFVASLHETVRRLLAAGKTVVLIYPVPEPGWDVPKYLVHRYLQGGGERMPTIDEARWRKRAASAYAMLDSAGDDPRLIRLKPADATCGRPAPGRCNLGSGGMPYYFDDDHPNRAGALAMIDGVLRKQGDVQALENALRQSGER